MIWALVKAALSAMGADSAILDAIDYLVSVLIDIATKPVEFAWSATFTLYLQAVALAIAIVAICMNAVRTFADGGSENETIAHFIWKSSWPVALIAACPALFTTLTGMVRQMVEDLVRGSVDSISLKAMVDGWLALDISELEEVKAVVLVVIAIVATYYVVTVLFQCVKRQVQLTVLSIVAPLVAANAAAEGGYADFLALLKEMLGAGVIMSLQMMMLISTMAYAISANANANAADPNSLLITIALFAATKQLPTWLTRYTSLSSVGMGRAGAQTTSSVVRTAVMSAALRR